MKKWVSARLQRAPLGMAERTLLGAGASVNSNSNSACGTDAGSAPR